MTIAREIDRCSIVGDRSSVYILFILARRSGFGAYSFIEEGQRLWLMDQFPSTGNATLHEVQV